MKWNPICRCGKRLLCLFLVILLSGVLSGCNLISLLLGPWVYPERPTVAFSEMTYERLDVDGYLEKVSAATQTITENKVSYKKQFNKLTDLNEGYWDYYTMYTLAYIRYAINTNDTFYKDEYVYLGEKRPTLSQALENLYVACSQSKYKGKFEQDYFGEGYLDQYKGGITLSDELVALLQQEAKLIQQYDAQAANPTVTYKGQTGPLEEMLDKAVLESQRQDILNAYYTQANQQLGSIYVDLVKVRMQIAQGLGYASYAEYAYESYERDYTPQMGAEFVSQVEQSLVPLYKSLFQNGYTQHPDLQGMAWQNVAGTVGNAVSQIDPAIQEIYAYMEEYDLYDLAPTAGKVSYDFTTYIDLYEAPFIVMCARENQVDLLSFAHEFGHFADMYLNYNSNYALDLSECASQGMEFLMLSYLPQSQQDLQSTLIEYKMYDTLYVYVVQSAYTAFEQAVYALPYDQVTLTRINQLAKDVNERFAFEDTDIFFDTDWVHVPHFFQEAFYCISYCVSSDVAFQIYQAECEKAGKGADLYMDLIQWDLDKTFLENLERVHLKNPCEKERVEALADFLSDYFQEDVAQAA